MASPQKEHGYVQLATEILLSLAKADLNGYERRYLDVLFCKTYGWHKKADWVANSQFVESMGVLKGHVSRTQASLLKRNIVTKNGNKLSFNKDYEQWLDKKGVTKLGITVTKNGNKKLPKMGDTKDSKDTYTKDKGATRGTKPMKNSFRYSENKHSDTFDDVVDAETGVVKKDAIPENWMVLLAAFKEVNPFWESLVRNKTERNALRELVEKLGRDKVLEAIKSLAVVIMKPYAPRITKPSELRRDYGKLLSFLSQEKGNEKLPVKHHKF